MGLLVPYWFLCKSSRVMISFLVCVSLHFAVKILILEKDLQKVCQII